MPFLLPAPLCALSVFDNPSLYFSVVNSFRKTGKFEGLSLQIVFLDKPIFFRNLSCSSCAAFIRFVCFATSLSPVTNKKGAHYSRNARLDNLDLPITNRCVNLTLNFSLKFCLHNAAHNQRCCPPNNAPANQQVNKKDSLAVFHLPILGNSVGKKV